MPTRISHKSLKQIIIISQKIFSTQNTIYEQYKTTTKKNNKKKSNTILQISKKCLPLQPQSGEMTKKQEMVR
ncbi:MULTISPECIES: hypothetical protein [unclassified Bacteroides]|uniref:hypothetical protein n=1 Tax=unclassified Bacteroides TaxID=2646097 RepID=UPI004063A97D